MGLFNMFKGDSGAEMTPHKAFATALLYCMASDGEMDPEEVGHLLSVIGGDRQGGTIGVGQNNKALLDAAMKYMRKHTVDQFLEEATPVLTKAQRLCVLMNIVDSAMADGEAEPEEQVVFDKMQKSFGITDDEFKPFFEALMIKNDRSVFLNQNHPNNSPDFQVKLSSVS